MQNTQIILHINVLTSISFYDIIVIEVVYACVIPATMWGSPPDKCGSTPHASPLIFIPVDWKGKRMYIDYSVLEPEIGSPLYMLYMYSSVQSSNHTQEYKNFCDMELVRVKNVINKFNYYIDSSNGIPFRDRQVLRLRFLYRLTWERIANLLGVSRDTVFRVRRKWVDELKNQGIMIV